MKVLVTQLCPTLCNPMDCSPSGSSVHGILEARILEWLAILFSRGSSSPGMEPVSRVSCIGRWVLYHQCHFPLIRVLTSTCVCQISTLALLMVVKQHLCGLFSFLWLPLINSSTFFMYQFSSCFSSHIKCCSNLRSYIYWVVSISYRFIGHL